MADDQGSLPNPLSATDPERPASGPTPTTASRAYQFLRAYWWQAVALLKALREGNRAKQARFARIRAGTATEEDFAEREPV